MCIEYINKLSKNDIEALCKLDANGFLVGQNENFEAYKKRLMSLYKKCRQFSDALSSEEYIEVDGMKVSKDSIIDKNVLLEASEITKNFYDFGITWVPGFFLKERIGPLWGGCAIFFPEQSFSIFLIRADFKNKEKWFIYSRKELLSHELCHVARMPLKDKSGEEYFAYLVSKSPFRRVFGNCFHTPIDAIMFLLPIFPILLGAEILKTFFQLSYPMYPFWILASLYPVFLLIRNFVFRFYIKKAKKNLASIGVREKALSVLFRCTTQEIKKLASLSDPTQCKTWIKSQSEKLLRWHVIRYRFINSIRF